MNLPQIPHSAGHRRRVALINLLADPLAQASPRHAQLPGLSRDRRALRSSPACSRTSRIALALVPELDLLPGIVPSSFHRRYATPTEGGTHETQVRPAGRIGWPCPGLASSTGSC
jgi:hypothetical protein